MANITFILSVFTAVTSFVAAVAALIGAYQKRKIESLTNDIEEANKKLFSAQNELYKVYLNVGELLQIENDLSAQLSVSKVVVRKNRHTDEYIQPKRVSKRIMELEHEIQRL